MIGVALVIDLAASLDQSGCVQVTQVILISLHHICDLGQLASHLTARVRSSYSSCATTALSGLSFGRLRGVSVICLLAVEVAAAAWPPAVCAKQFALRGGGHRSCGPVQSSLVTYDLCPLPDMLSRVWVPKVRQG